MAPLVETYTKLLRVLELVSEGRTLTSACDEVNIGVGTFVRHVQSQEEFQDLFAEAEQRGYDTLADILLEINTHHYYAAGDAKMANVLSSNIKWYLSKKQPKKYGEKITVENIYTLDRTITDALARARDRATGVQALEHLTQEIIDVPFQVVEDKVAAVVLSVDEQAELDKLV